jgi:transcriptional regulator with XRE-family HTH domain
MNLNAGQQITGVWMKLIDAKRLRKLMVIQGVSARELARQAGWKSHSYMNRLLDSADPTDTLEVEPAVRIAAFLGVGVDDLFLARVSSDDVQHSGGRKAS